MTACVSSCRHWLLLLLPLLLQLVQLLTAAMLKQLQLVLLVSLETVVRLKVMGWVPPLQLHQQQQQLVASPLPS
jgi:hypothetical protein